MTDIFDYDILCRKCGSKMSKISLEKQGFVLRAVKCDKCNLKIVHPKDEKEFNDFIKLRNKTYKVKMRVVGNSYAVSIPKEIVNFIKEQEKVVNDMVKLCFDDCKRLSLMFGEDI